MLCERCGRTICPECQIPTPNGVYCPDCVRETSGVGPAVGLGRRPPVSNVTPIRRRRTPRWWRQVKQWLVPESGAPVVTWSVLGAVVVMYFVILIAGRASALLLAACAGPAGVAARGASSPRRFVQSSLDRTDPQRGVLRADRAHDRTPSRRGAVRHHPAGRRGRRIGGHAARRERGIRA